MAAARYRCVHQAFGALPHAARAGCAVRDDCRMQDGRLFGRDAERATLAALLAAARAGRSGALVIRGDAGLGKTALLAELAARADGLTVLATAGVPAEATIPFAGLHHLLHAVLGAAEQLPERLRAALERALGLREGPAPESLLLGAAVLGVICAAAPVLVSCDDAQWLDGPSLGALAFAGRRLGEDGVALVVAGREELPGLGLDELVLAPLAEADAAALLAHREVAEPVRRRVLDAAAGNPLALVELAAAPRLAEGGAMPVPERLRAVYAEQVEGLPPDARHLLLLLAADGTGDARAALAAADGGSRDAAVAAIESSGLARLVGGEVRWRHPLAREAVLAGVDGAELRAAHRVLAGAADTDRAAWHRAEAALGPDEEIAAALAAAGRRAAARGGHGAAADALARAAQLSPEPAACASRTVEAAAEAWSAGRSGQAASLLAAGYPPTPELEAESARIRGAVELHGGSPAVAHRLLAEAAARLVRTAPERALRLGLSAMEAASLAGEPRGLPFDLDSVPVAADDAPKTAPAGGRGAPALLHRLAGGLSAFIAGDLAAAVPAIREVIAEAPAVTDPQLLLWAGAAAFFTGDETAAVALHEHAVVLARERGDAAVLAFALTFLAAAHLWSGRPAFAQAEAEEARRLAVDAGLDNLALQVDAVRAGIAALRGQEATCRALAADVMGLARDRGLVLAEGAAAVAVAELELASGAPEAARERLHRLAHGAGAHPAHRFSVIPPLVEAAARAGRAAEAAADAAAFAAWAEATGSPWARPLATRGLALVATTPDNAEALFERARGEHDGHQRPLDRARTDLLAGEQLRRDRRKAEARVPLQAALEVFEGAGATLWAARARDELRAAGASPPQRVPRPLDRLTPQELRIARLVAQGASNRDAGAALFLSPRTVEYHLHKVFKKLDVHNRAELAALLTGAQTG
jgi:DNA-binding CsgD family transcriptional regulator